MTSSHGYTIGLLSAVAVHAALLFGIQPAEEVTPPEFGIEAHPPGVEVTLVAALPALEKEAPPEAPEPSTPEIEEPPPEPITPPEITPEPATEPAPEPSPESEPTPEPAIIPPQPPAPPRSSPPPPRPKQPPRATRSTSHSGDGSSPVPGADATSAHASSGSFSARPGYLRNPHPAYPEEARRAGQQGVVHLAVKVDERGRVTQATVARSSGHPTLDERALTTVRERWVFKPARQGNRPVPAEVMIPVRFTLENR